jgi:hypothetical protein
MNTGFQNPLLSASRLGNATRKVGGSSTNYSDGTPRNRNQNNTTQPSQIKAAPVTQVRTSQNSYPPTSQYDSGSDYGPVAPAEPAAPKINPEVDYLKEAGFMAQASALDKALQEFQSQDKAERGRYDIDYKKGLGDLGYRDENIDDNIAGQWDWNDVLTASGRGYQQNTNDFAARGMLQSQGYFDSLKNLERSLEDQRGAMGTARQNFGKERDEGMATYVNQDKASRDAARIAAIERLSSSLGLTG